MASKKNLLEKIEITIIMCNLYTMIANWQEFKLAFKEYITNTIGIFTHYNPENLVHFNLDAFLERLTAHNNLLSRTQYEALIALSTFIGIQENYQNIHINTIPINVKLQFKILIERNLLYFSPLSEIKANCMNILMPHATTATAAAA
jgi:hypothetical protein